MQIEDGGGSLSKTTRLVCFAMMVNINHHDPAQKRLYQLSYEYEVKASASKKKGSRHSVQVGFGSS